MKIAPIDIAHKSFSKKVMGLDSEEVQEFLRNIADEMENVIRERNHLRETLREKELAIMEYRERDETLKQTIQTATKMAEKMREDGEREAKIIMNDAEQKADLIVRDARDSLKKTYEEISELKRIKIQMEASIRGALEAHKNLLEQTTAGLTRPRPIPHSNAPVHARPGAEEGIPSA